MGDPTQPGALVGGRFVLGRKLGRGGYATVWRASDTQGGPDVAVKMLHRELRLSATAQQRLRREVSVLCRLDHANIARAIDVQLDRAEPFFAMELIKGSSLDRAIAERAQDDTHFPNHEARWIFEQICRAVGEAHRQGVVHRDLKPANVMVDVAGGRPAVKVLDFGLAKLLRGDDSQTTEGRALGSLSYMSPEQGAGKPVDERTDIFALGVLLFELLTLRRTWARDEHGEPLRAYCVPVRANRYNAIDRLVSRIAAEARTPPSHIRPGVDPSTDAFLARLLAIQPEERFASVDEVLANLPEELAEDDQLKTRSIVRPPARTGTALRPSEPSADYGTQVREELPATRLTSASSGSSQPSFSSEPSISAEPSVPPSFSSSFAAPNPAGQTVALGWKIAVAVLSVMCVTFATVAVLALRARSNAPTPAPTSTESTTPTSAPLSARPGVRAKTPTPAKVSTPAKVPTRPSAAAPPRAPARAPREATPTPRPQRSPIDRVRRLYASAVQNPTDIGTLQQLETAISEASQSIDDPRRRARINRIARSSAELGDLNGLQRAVRDLEEALP